MYVCMYVPGGAGAEGLVEVEATFLLDGSWLGPSKCMCMWVRSILVAQERVKITELKVNSKHEINLQ